jgi:hypothetical protein
MQIQDIFVSYVSYKVILLSVLTVEIMQHQFSYSRTIMYQKMEGMWHEVVMTYFKVISWQMNEDTEESTESSKSWPLAGV